MSIWVCFLDSIQLGRVWKNDQKSWGVVIEPCLSFLIKILFRGRHGSMYTGII